MWKGIILQSLSELAILLFLYLEAPVFAPESDGEIEESARIILKCFDELSGGLKSETKKIYGNIN